MDHSINEKRSSDFRPIFFVDLELGNSCIHSVQQKKALRLIDIDFKAHRYNSIFSAISVK